MSELKPGDPVGLLAPLGHGLQAPGKFSTPRATVSGVDPAYAGNIPAPFPLSARLSFPFLLAAP